MIGRQHTSMSSPLEVLNTSAPKPFMAALCSICQSFTVDDFRFVTCQHQPSLQALEASSSSCPFCDLLWHALAETCTKVSIETHLGGHVYGRDEDTDTAIRIRGEFHDQTEPVPEKGIQDSLLWVFSGKSHDEGVDYRTQVFGKLRLFAKADDPCATVFPGRELSSRPSAPAAMDSMKAWISRCRNHHRCNFGKEAALPTRLIDLSPMRKCRHPVLVETAGQKGVYVALSYCWGADQTLKTTSENYHEFTTLGIDFAKLSQTLQDAISVTRLLDFRWIWIDAICIIQNSGFSSDTANADFNREGLRMADYYGNASLTILAGSCSDSRQGFLETVRPSVINHQQAVGFDYSQHDGTRIGHIYASKPSSHHIGPLETRAWTLQEDFLSPRRLIFGEEQIGYKCGVGEVWEDGTANVAKWKNKGPFDVTPRMILAAHTSNPHAEAKSRMLRQWYSLLQTYSRRARGNTYDKLTAIAGVAQRSHQLIGGRYLFGLWDNDMIRGLLWRSGWKFKEDPYPSLPLTKCEVFAAPSWSWASKEGPIICQYTTEREENTYLNSSNTRVTISSRCGGVESIFDPIRTSIPLSSWHLEVSGALKAVQCAYGPVAPLPRECKRMAYPRSRERMINLVPNEAESGLSSSTTCEVVAVALPDAHIQPRDEFFCLRLIAQEGLLLKRLEGSNYERIGVFLVVDMEWFDCGETEALTLI